MAGLLVRQDRTLAEALMRELSARAADAVLAFNEPYRIEEGHLILNGKPGLGYAIDEERLRAVAQ